MCIRDSPVNTLLFGIQYRFRDFVIKSILPTRTVTIALSTMVIFTQMIHLYLRVMHKGGYPWKEARERHGSLKVHFQFVKARHTGKTKRWWTILLKLEKRSSSWRSWVTSEENLIIIGQKRSFRKQFTIGAENKNGWHLQTRKHKESAQGHWRCSLLICIRICASVLCVFKLLCKEKRGKPPLLPTRKNRRTLCFFKHTVRAQVTKH